MPLLRHTQTYVFPQSLGHPSFLDQFELLGMRSGNEAVLDNKIIKPVSSTRRCCVRVTGSVTMMEQACAQYTRAALVLRQR
jgi:hypothetical protein